MKEYPLLCTPLDDIPIKTSPDLTFWPETIFALSAIPTKIYVKLVLDLLKRYDIKSIAHITGGGVIENIPRVIHKGLGIDINKNSWEKPAIFKLIESFNAIDERELHKSFNMGIGLVMVVEKDKAEEVVNFINNREEEIHVDAKYTELMKDRAYIIGEVVDTHEGVNLC